MFNIDVELDPQFDGPKDSMVSSLLSHVMLSEGISQADLLLIFGDDDLLAVRDLPVERVTFFPLKVVEDLVWDRDDVVVLGISGNSSSVMHHLI